MGFAEISLRQDRFVSLQTAVVGPRYPALACLGHDLGCFEAMNFFAMWSWVALNVETTQ